jgi:hypothetical protein
MEPEETATEATAAGATIVLLPSILPTTTIVGPTATRSAPITTANVAAVPPSDTNAMRRARTPKADPNEDANDGGGVDTTVTVT